VLRTLSDLILLHNKDRTRTPTTIRRTLFVTFVETGNPAFIFLNILKIKFCPILDSYLKEFLTLRTTIQGIHSVVIIIIPPETKKVGKTIVLAGANDTTTFLIYQGRQL
jgi:hypothetical protein